MTDRSDDRHLMLNAALDGELDAAGMLDIERAIAADSALAAEHARLKNLQDAIRTHAPRDIAPAGLRARIAAAAGDAKPAKATLRVHRLADWRKMAASVAFLAVLLTGAYTVLRPDPAQNIAQAVTRDVVAGQMRALVSGRPVDVETSDRHTVKPWLAGRAPLATAAVDLAADGFPLIGGRIDIVQGAAVPTLVYQRREHLISVTELSHTLVRYAGDSQRRMVEGYATLTWSDRERSYVAVSDIASADFDAFVAAFRRAAAQEQSE
jgi:anti-sigma factor RsiW